MNKEKVLNYCRKGKSNEPKELEQQRARTELFALDGDNKINEVEDGTEGGQYVWKKLSEDVENGKVSHIMVENKDRLPEDSEISASCEKKRIGIYGLE